MAAPEAIDGNRATERTWQALTSAPRPLWSAAVVAALALIALGCVAVGRRWIDGTAALGDNLPVGRGGQAVAASFWTGVSAGGLLLSSALVLSRRRWRSAISRTAQAIALAALIGVAWHGVVGLGRPDRLAELLPWPDASGLAPNLHSPAFWIPLVTIALALAALLVWLWGLVPDLEIRRERGGSGGRVRWTGWQRWQPAIAAASAMIAVAAVVTSSLPQLLSALPGWHDPLLPIHDLARGTASAVALTTIALVFGRRALQLEPLITPHHLDRLCRLLLALTGLVVYCRGVAFFHAWYAGTFDQAVAFDGQAFGDQRWAYWGALASIAIVPQSFWWRPARRQPAWVALASLLVAIGLWLDGWVTLIAPQQHALIGASWGPYRASAWDVALIGGGVGWFALLVALLLRAVPPIAIADLRHDVAESAARASFTDEEPTP